MKKNYSILLFLASVINLNAQITLTSSTSSPQVGDTFNYVTIPNYTLNVSQSGANQTWDFSTATGTTEATNIIDLSSSSEPLIFPSASIVSSNTNGEVYISSNSSEYSIEGIFSSGLARTIYTDNQEVLKFPITYNDVFNETFSGTIENFVASQTFNRTGTTEIVADGYGSLILPYTTINNVLRIKITNITTDVFMGIPLPPVTDVILVWYDTANKSHLASTTNVYQNGALISSQATYISQLDLVLSIDDSNLKDNDITIFPNPANNYIKIKNRSYKTPINIYDLKGVFIKSIIIENGKTEIDISSFASGTYLIKYIKNTQLITKKLVVK